MPAGPRYSIYSAPIKNESKISLPPSLPPTLALANARSMHANGREYVTSYSEFYYLDCERGRLVRSSLARLIPPRQPRTRERLFQSCPLEKLLFPPHWSDTEEGEREYSERRERNAWYSNCGCAQKRFERGAGQPRVFFPSFFFFPLFERGANRVSTSVLVHAHAVTNGHDRYPYLNTGRKYQTLFLSLSLSIISSTRCVIKLGVERQQLVVTGMLHTACCAMSFPFGSS